MLRVFLVGAGGFLGAILRYAVGGCVHNILDNAWFPYGTLVVNFVGCLLIGFLSGLAEIVPYSVLRSGCSFLSVSLEDSRLSRHLPMKLFRLLATMKISRQRLTSLPS